MADPSAPPPDLRTALPNPLGHHQPLGASLYLQRSQTLGAHPLSVLDLALFFPQGLPDFDQADSAEEATPTAQSPTVQPQRVEPGSQVPLERGSGANAWTPASPSFTAPLPATTAPTAGSFSEFVQRQSGQNLPSPPALVRLDEPATPGVNAVWSPSSAAATWSNSATAVAAASPAPGATSSIQRAAANPVSPALAEEIEGAVVSAISAELGTNASPTPPVAPVGLAQYPVNLAESSSAEPQPSANQALTSQPFPAAVISEVTTLGQSAAPVQRSLVADSGSFGGQSSPAEAMSQRVEDKDSFATAVGVNYQSVNSPVADLVNQPSQPADAHLQRQTETLTHGVNQPPLSPADLAPSPAAKAAFQPVPSTDKITAASSPSTPDPEPAAGPATSLVTAAPGISAASSSYLMRSQLEPSQPASAPGENFPQSSHPPAAKASSRHAWIQSYFAPDASSASKAIGEATPMPPLDSTLASVVQRADDVASASSGPEQGGHDAFGGAAPTPTNTAASRASNDRQETSTALGAAPLAAPSSAIISQNSEAFGPDRLATAVNDEIQRSTTVAGQAVGSVDSVQRAIANAPIDVPVTNAPTVNAPQPLPIQDDLARSGSLHQRPFQADVSPARPASSIPPQQASHEHIQPVRGTPLASASQPQPPAGVLTPEIQRSELGTAPQEPMLHQQAVAPEAKARPELDSPSPLAPPYFSSSALPASSDHSVVETTHSNAVPSQLQRDSSGISPNSQQEIVNSADSADRGAKPDQPKTQSAATIELGQELRDDSPALQRAIATHMPGSPQQLAGSSGPEFADLQENAVSSILPTAYELKAGVAAHTPNIQQKAVSPSQSANSDCEQDAAALAPLDSERFQTEGENPPSKQTSHPETFSPGSTPQIQLAKLDQESAAAADKLAGERPNSSLLNPEAAPTAAASDQPALPPPVTGGAVTDGTVADGPTTDSPADRLFTDSPAAAGAIASRDASPQLAALETTGEMDTASLLLAASAPSVETDSEEQPGLSAFSAAAIPGEAPPASMPTLQRTEASRLEPETTELLPQSRDLKISGSSARVQPDALGSQRSNSQVVGNSKTSLETSSEIPSAPDIQLRGAEITEDASALPVQPFPVQSEPSSPQGGSPSTPLTSTPSTFTPLVSSDSPQPSLSQASGVSSEEPFQAEAATTNPAGGVFAPSTHSAPPTVSTKPAEGLAKTVNRLMRFFTGQPADAAEPTSAPQANPGAASEPALPKAHHGHEISNAPAELTAESQHSTNELSRQKLPLRGDQANSQNLAPGTTQSPSTSTLSITEGADLGSSQDLFQTLTSKPSSAPETAGQTLQRATAGPSAAGPSAPAVAVNQFHDDGQSIARTTVPEDSPQPQTQRFSNQAQVISGESQQKPAQLSETTGQALLQPTGPTMPDLKMGQQISQPSLSGTALPDIARKAAPGGEPAISTHSFSAAVEENSSELPEQSGLATDGIGKEFFPTEPETLSETSNVAIPQQLSQQEAPQILSRKADLATSPQPPNESNPRTPAAAAETKFEVPTPAVPEQSLGESTPQVLSRKADLATSPQTPNEGNLRTPAAAAETKFEVPTPAIPERSLGESTPQVLFRKAEVDSDSAPSRAEGSADAASETPSVPEQAPQVLVSTSSSTAVRRAAESSPPQSGDPAQLKVAAEKNALSPQSNPGCSAAGNVAHSGPPSVARGVETEHLPFPESGSVASAGEKGVTSLLETPEVSADLHAPTVARRIELGDVSLQGRGPSSSQVTGEAAAQTKMPLSASAQTENHSDSQGVYSLPGPETSAPKIDLFSANSSFSIIARKAEIDRSEPQGKNRDFSSPSAAAFSAATQSPGSVENGVGEGQLPRVLQPLGVLESLIQPRTQELEPPSGQRPSTASLPPVDQSRGADRHPIQTAEVASAPQSWPQALPSAQDGAQTAAIQRAESGAVPQQWASLEDLVQQQPLSAVAENPISTHSSATFHAAQPSSGHEESLPQQWSSLDDLMQPEAIAQPESSALEPDLRGAPGKPAIQRKAETAATSQNGQRDRKISPAKSRTSSPERGTLAAPSVQLKAVKPQPVSLPTVQAKASQAPNLQAFQDEGFVTVSAEGPEDEGSGEALERLAQEIYHRLCDRIAIEVERRGAGYPKRFG